MWRSRLGRRCLLLVCHESGGTPFAARCKHGIHFFILTAVEKTIVDNKLWILGASTNCDFALQLEGYALGQQHHYAVRASRPV
jgi:hypothetical protein